MQSCRKPYSTAAPSSSSYNSGATSATMAPPLAPVRGDFDVSQFVHSISLRAVKVKQRYTSLVLKEMRESLIDYPKVKPVVPFPEDPDIRLILLKPSAPLLDNVVVSMGSGAAHATAAASLGVDSSESTSVSSSSSGLSATSAAEATTKHYVVSSSEGIDASSISSSSSLVSSSSSSSSSSASSSSSSSLLSSQNDHSTTALILTPPLLGIGAVLVDYVLTLDYSSVTASSALRRLLPPSIATRDIPSSFEQAGHLAHINLSDELMPYRYLIGRVFLDKNPQLKTVVAKVGMIDTAFRTFPMEVVAGVDDTIVQVKETGAIFRFDFRRVYWNSRLGHEHERIVYSMGEGEVIADMFGGVGPFAVPLAMALDKGGRECCVHANDLNPVSYDALLENALLNHVPTSAYAAAAPASDSASSSMSSTASASSTMSSTASASSTMSSTASTSFSMSSTASASATISISSAASSAVGTRPPAVGQSTTSPHSSSVRPPPPHRSGASKPRGSGSMTCYNLDGRDFIRLLVKERVPFRHVLMNLPADGLSFCDVFVGLYRPNNTDRDDSSNNSSSSSSSVSNHSMHTGEESSSATLLPSASPTPPTALDMPIIHTYCFSRAETYKEAAYDVKKRLLQYLEIIPKEVGLEALDPTSYAFISSVEAAAETIPSSSPSSSSSSASAAASSTVRALLVESVMSPPEKQRIDELIEAHFSDLTVVEVRDVAPKKLMLCVEFTLPLEVALKDTSLQARASLLSSLPQPAAGVLPAKRPRDEPHVDTAVGVAEAPSQEDGSKALLPPSLKRGKND